MSKKQKMLLQHIATRIDCFNVIEIDVRIGKEDKIYTYSMSSEYLYRVFLVYMKRKWFNKAFNIIKICNIDTEK